MVPFIPAAELKDTYGIFGHFYSVEVAANHVVNCRSVLEIIHREDVPAKLSQLSGQRPDAVFIMMNPGSSEPLEEVNNQIQASSIHRLTVSLVPTKPDTTQYQVMRLMHYCNWRHIRVLNLSDLRCTKSVLFFRQFQHLEREYSFDSHSVFSIRRRKELESKLTGHTGLPVIRAWGLSDELDPLIERCLSQTNSHQTTYGLTKDGLANKYLHPLPSLQKQKLIWVHRMVEQCRR